MKEIIPFVAAFEARSVPLLHIGPGVQRSSLFKSKPMDTAKVKKRHSALDSHKSKHSWKKLDIAARVLAVPLSCALRTI